MESRWWPWEPGKPSANFWIACQMTAAWPRVAALVTRTRTDKPLLLATIDAEAGIRPQDAPGILGGPMDSRDEDIVEAVQEALAMAEASPDQDDDEDDEFPDDGRSRPG